jgi:hypothetical protein
LPVVRIQDCYQTESRFSSLRWSTKSPSPLPASLIYIEEVQRDVGIDSSISS